MGRYLWLLLVLRSLLYRGRDGGDGRDGGGGCYGADDLSAPRVGSFLPSQFTQGNIVPSFWLQSVCKFLHLPTRASGHLFPSLHSIPESISSFCADITSPAPALWLFLSCSLCPFDLWKMSFSMLVIKVKLNQGSRAGRLGPEQDCVAETLAGLSSSDWEAAVANGPFAGALSTEKAPGFQGGRGQLSWLHLED